jgi:uncharacterized membrane protein
MHKGRLEAFSDGVLAIIITIMVLELKVPHGSDLAALQKLGPVFLAYVLSFVNVGIYWNNHHHMMQAVKHVNGPILWANLHLLFWLSLFPFATAWMGENHFDTWPVAVYGFVSLMAGVAYYILGTGLVRNEGPDSILAAAFGADTKGRISVILYSLGTALAFVNRWVALAIYVTVSIYWLVPDRRIEGKALD